MTQNNKDTIYIDVDDEITAIVDKVQASSSKIVALVLPKRAVVLQSIVNMKLLKRAASDNDKQVVLITSETGLLPLAGASGLYVAKNLQSKPEIPDSPEVSEGDENEVIENMDDQEDADTSVGAMAGAAAIGAAASKDKNTANGSANQSPKKAAKTSKPKTSKIPNFEKFRKKIFIIIGAVLLLVIAWVLGVFVLPKADITITTDTETINSSFEFTASESTNNVNADDNIVPAEFALVEQQDSQKVAATGTKDLSSKASGTVTLSIACSDVNSFPEQVPAGTGVSSQGLTFITQSTTTLSSPGSGGGCNFSGSTEVVSQNKGDQYNIAAASYTVSGYSDVTGNGSAMTGGSSKTIKVVSQQDVDSAKNQLDINEDKIKNDLTKELEDRGLFVVTNSFNKQNETTDVKPNVGQEANEVAVTYSANFYIVGIKKEDMRQLIENNIQDQIDTEKQQVQDDGIDNASFEIVGGDIASGSVIMSINTDAEVGPEIDLDQLKTDIAGKKSGETENTISSLPGVKEVQVDYSPFWVNKTPSSNDKITIKFKSSEED